MKRRVFLTEFLSALGAESIEWREETENFILGRVIYEKNDSGEIQDFCWHTSEEKTPSTHALKLVKLLNKKKLLSIDQISITREELRLKYNEMYGSNTAEPEFIKILEELEEVEVPMVDEGKETDAYFIHE